MDQCVEEKGDPESEDYMVRTSSLSTPSKFCIEIFMWLFPSGQEMTITVVKQKEDWKTDVNNNRSRFFSDKPIHQNDIFKYMNCIFI